MQKYVINHTKSLMELNMWLRRCGLIGCSMVLPLPSSLMLETGSARELKANLGTCCKHRLLAMTSYKWTWYNDDNTAPSPNFDTNCMLHQHIDCNIPHNTTGPRCTLVNRASWNYVPCQRTQTVTLAVAGLKLTTFMV